jgi:hypothetical protein
MKKNCLKKSLKNEKKKKKETAQPFTVDYYNERLSSFSIFLIGFDCLNSSSSFL